MSEDLADKFTVVGDPEHLPDAAIEALAKLLLDAHRRDWETEQGRGRTEEEPPPSPLPPGEQIIRWRGTIPSQKWTNFYIKVLSRFSANPKLKLEASFEVPIEREQVEGKLAETRAGLKDLGLNDNVATS